MEYAAEKANSGEDQHQLAWSQEIPNYGNKLLKRLDEFRKTTILYDVRVLADGGEFNAHKVILAACGGIFRTCFVDEKKKMIASDVTELNLDCPAQGLKPIMRFAYTGALVVTKKNAIATMIAAEVTKMKEVQEICADIAVKEYGWVIRFSGVKDDATIDNLGKVLHLHAPCLPNDSQITDIPGENTNEMPFTVEVGKAYPEKRVTYQKLAAKLKSAEELLAITKADTNKDGPAKQKTPTWDVGASYLAPPVAMDTSLKEVGTTNPESVVAESSSLTSESIVVSNGKKKPPVSDPAISDSALTSNSERKSPVPDPTISDSTLTSDGKKRTAVTKPIPSESDTLLTSNGKKKPPLPKASPPEPESRHNSNVRKKPPAPKASPPTSDSPLTSDNSMKPVARKTSSDPSPENAVTSNMKKKPPAPKASPPESEISLTSDDMKKPAARKTSNPNQEIAVTSNGRKKPSVNASPAKTTPPKPENIVTASPNPAERTPVIEIPSSPTIKPRASVRSKKAAPPPPSPNPALKTPTKLPPPSPKTPATLPPPRPQKQPARPPPPRPKPPVKKKSSSDSSQDTPTKNAADYDDNLNPFA